MKIDWILLSLLLCLWNVSFYLMIGSLFTVVTLTYVHLGKKRFWQGFTAVVLLLVVAIFLIIMILKSNSNDAAILLQFLIVMGITPTGIQLLNPILLFSAFSLCYGLIGFLIIKRIELF